MSYASENLDFSIWAESTSISHKKFEKGKHQCRRNMRAKVGDYIWCPSCRKKIRKQQEWQVTCLNQKCKDMAYIYTSEIKELKMNNMETKEINIAEILKDCPKGTKLYSPAFGDLFLEEVGTERIYAYKDINSNEYIIFYPDGRYDLKGECMLFPSREQCNWSRFEPNQPVSYFIGDNGKVWFLKGEKTEEDEKRAKFGNEFSTREQAEYAAKRVKELLLSFRKEDK